MAPRALARTLLLPALVAGAYYVAARFSLLLSLEGTLASPVWPPSGIALAMIALFGLRAAPGIFAGAFLANALPIIAAGRMGTPAIALAAGGVAAGNTLEAVAGGILLARWLPDWRKLDRIGSVLSFFAVAPLACLIAAAIGPLVHYVAGIIPRELLGTASLTWWLGDTVGMLVVTPFVLAWWSARGQTWSRLRVAEGTALVVLAVAVSRFALDAPNELTPAGPALEFLVIPFMVWAAIRFGILGAASVVAAIAGLAVLETARGQGLFAVDGLNASLLGLQAYLAFVTLTLLLIAALSAEREREHRDRAARSRQQAALSRLGRFALSGASLDQLEHLADSIVAEEARAGDPAGRSAETHFVEAIDDVVQAARRRKEAEEALRHKTDLLQVLASSISSFVEKRRWLDAASCLVSGAQELTASVCGFWGVVEESHLHILAHKDASSEVAFDTRVDLASLPEATGESIGGGSGLLILLSRVIQGGEVVVCNEPIPGRIPDGLPFGQGPIARFLGAPIRQGGDVVGMIAVINRAGDYRPADRTTIESLAKAAAMLYDSYRRASRESSLEAALSQSQKMDAVGRLAGGVAHDFNNLLTVIIGHAEHLMEESREDPAASRSLRQITLAAERSAGLTRQLLAFSRKQILQPKALRLNDVVSGILEMLRRVIGEDVHCVTRLDPSLRWVKADPGQLEQVIMNLAVNSRDAMPEGGEIFIRTANVRVDERAPEASQGLPPGEYVKLTFSDTGCGMDAETRAHIFEPFFTTKGPGRGTGLGLSTVYGVVKQSGGYIYAESAVSKGATFSIFLPPVAPPPLEIGAAEPAVEIRGAGDETVLLVEDEELVRSLLKTTLERQQYRILEAGSAEEALAICRRESGPIDLVITDIVMPGMSGWQLVEKLLEVRPGANVLYMSGYTEHSLLGDGRTPAGAHFIHKPFAPDSLCRVVRKILDGETAA
ncbi:MAG: MASE1 domain-containing protein [Acidobacteria bacterium]|nr:MASE1 domain-containing protein [Acidobacteriota bacterium]